MHHLLTQGVSQGVIFKYMQSSSMEIFVIADVFSKCIYIFQPVMRLIEKHSSFPSLFQNFPCSKKILTIVVLMHGIE